jgi:glycosyltransferase involved in cell wall biosynthesis
VANALTLQPDVIHFFKPKAYAGLAHLGLWWLRRLGVRSARLVLDTDDWEQAWNNILPYPAWQKRFFSWQEQWGLRRADAVTAASRELVRRVGPWRSEQSSLFYVPNGFFPGQETQQPGPAHAANLVVSTEQSVQLAQAAGQVLRKQWRLDQEPLILLYTRFIEFRLERIVMFVKCVANQIPLARWLIVGQGLQGEEERLAAMLTEADLATYVHFTGWLPVEESPACFAAANVAIYPYDDTIFNRTKCSVKLIDLLRAGLPVVADAVGQNCEYIEHNVSGILIAAEQDERFGNALVDLLQDPQRQQQLGSAAAEFMQQNFNWLVLVKNVEKAYKV